MRKNKEQVLVLILIVSLIFNLRYVFKEWNAPDYKIGTLRRDIKVSVYQTGTDDEEILLPQGLIVENRSPEGIPRIGQFEPERFSITITSDDPNLVNDSSKAAKQRKQALYPAERIAPVP